MLPILLSLLLLPQPSLPDFTLKDGDRVVLVGSTFIERENKYGIWEAALRRSFPGKKVTFRNLGWSGDTVWGESRAGFDKPEVGYKRLVEQLISQKPTVLIVGYGSNEAFAGLDGVSKFKEGLNKLLDAVQPAPEKLVLLSTVHLESTPTAVKEAAKLYDQVIRETAQQRKGIYSDLNYVKREIDFSFEDYSPGFYERTAVELLRSLSNKPIAELKLTIGEKHEVTAKNISIREMKDKDKEKVWDLQMNDSRLLRIEIEPVNVKRNFSPYTRWSLSGKRLDTHHESIYLLDDLMAFRDLIREKNRLFFQQYRPSNDVYLIGFRKHEQGKNAVEIQQYTPLIDKLEAQIHEMNLKPLPTRLYLKPESRFSDD